MPLFAKELRRPCTEPLSQRHRRTVRKPPFSVHLTIVLGDLGAGVGLRVDGATWPEVSRG